MLNKEVDQGNQGAKEATGNPLPVLDRLCVRRAKRNASGGPRDRKDNVRDHEDIVPVMVVGRGDVGPAAASKSSDDTAKRNRFGEDTAGLGSQEIPESNKGESRTCRTLAWRRKAHCVVWGVVL